MSMLRPTENKIAFESKSDAGMGTWLRPYELFYPCDLGFDRMTLTYEGNVT